MNTPRDRHSNLEYLLQRDIITDFIPRIGEGQRQTIYNIADEPPDTFAIFSALLEPKAVKEALKKDDWDLSIGEGLPGFSQSCKRSRTITTYHRFGSDDGIRPLVIKRDFRGAWSPYLELCEEFRHFHNLAEDRKRGVLLAFDESGYEVEVAWISEHRGEVDLSYLKRFLSATQLYLAVYFDSVRYSLIELENIPEENRLLEYQDAISRYSMQADVCYFREDYRSFSRLLGKVIIAPPPIEECNQWPFEKAKNEPRVSFIGLGPDGGQKEYAGDPDALSNYSSNPDYLAPVYFRKQVLQKYYDEPERYSVEDGYIQCCNLWGMRIDNSHPTHVVALLGDLFRDLPPCERLHWKQYNVPPPRDVYVSEPFYRRSFLGQFADPTSVDLVFREEYEQLNKVWRERKGWSLFLDLAPEDKHIQQAIHIPVTDSQRELDEQILWLAKLLVDSLNEREIANTLTEKLEGGKGIDKFERFLKSEGFPKVRGIIEFLRGLQNLRSSGSAHRKGAEYDKILAKLGLEEKRGPEIMQDLLTQAVEMLRALRQFVEAP